MTYDVARAGALLNQVQYQTCVPSLEACELTKEGRRDVVEYIMRVQAVRNVGRIHAETRLVSFGTLRPGYVEAKLPVQPDIKRKINRETLAIGHAGIILKNIHV
jgi:hypothetical protein